MKWFAPQESQFYIKTERQSRVFDRQLPECTTSVSLCSEVGKLVTRPRQWIAPLFPYRQCFNMTRVIVVCFGNCKFAVCCLINTQLSKLLKTTPTRLHIFVTFIIGFNRRGMYIVTRHKLYLCHQNICIPKTWGVCPMSQVWGWYCCLPGQRQEGSKSEWIFANVA